MKEQRGRVHKRKEELIKKAYVLGYEVGYYSHYESVGWVKKELRKLLTLAKDAGIEQEVLTAYKRGKIDSARKRSLEITEGREIPVDETVINIRAERTMIKVIRRSERTIKFISLPRFLKRRNQF